MIIIRCTGKDKKKFKILNEMKTPSEIKKEIWENYIPTNFTPHTRTSFYTWAYDS